MKILITRNPEILGGKPTVAGTRMSVEVILEFLAGGMEIKEILKEYPFLTKDHIRAAVEYAAAAVEEKTKKHPTKIEKETPAMTPHEVSRRR